MTDPTLESRSALASALLTSQSTVEIEAAGDRTIIHIAARKGQSEAIKQALAADFGAAPPASPGVVTTHAAAFVWAGPDQWLAIAPENDAGTLERDLMKLKDAGLAALTDQSDQRILVRIFGPNARAVLAKGVPVDLHPRAFPAGSAAITHAAHIGVILWRADASDTFVLACPRSYGVSLWSWLMEAAAAYGPAVR